MVRYLTLAAWTVALVAGCHQPVQPAEPTAQRVAMADDGSMDRLWVASQDVLRDHRFELARVDRRAMTITTLPVTSQSALEFWRHDVDTPYDLMESTLRTVRRSATVQVEQPPDAGSAGVRVTVRKETFATPERQFNNSASSLRVFGDELPGVQGERRLTHRDDYWIDAGRDGAMERRLLERILAQAALLGAPAE